jgi:hypothetical protein
LWKFAPAGWKTRSADAPCRSGGESRAMTGAPGDMTETPDP